MKKILGTLLLLFLFANCSNNKYEKRLIGTWNSYPTGGMAEIRLYPDSIVSWDISAYRKGTWKADDSQIKLHFPKKLPGYQIDLTLDYKINNKNDSLLIKNTTDSIYRIPALLKVDNVWKHYLKEFDLQIDLPKADFELIRNDYMDLGIDLYIGIRKGEVVVKSNGFENLTQLKSLVFSERSIRKEDEINDMNFNLIIDKNISSYKIDSIKQILKVFPKMRVFTVYANDTANYGKYPGWREVEYWNWYGKYE